MFGHREPERQRLHPVCQLKLCPAFAESIRYGGLSPGFAGNYRCESALSDRLYQLWTCALHPAHLERCYPSHIAEASLIKERVARTPCALRSPLLFFEEYTSYNMGGSKQFDKVGEIVAQSRRFRHTNSPSLSAKRWLKEKIKSIACFLSHILSPCGGELPKSSLAIEMRSLNSVNLSWLK